MSGSANKPSSRYWHQGFIISKDGKGRDCLRFQTFGIAIRVSEKASKHGFKLGLYQDGGDWCLRPLAKSETIWADVL